MIPTTESCDKANECSNVACIHKNNPHRLIISCKEYCLDENHSKCKEYTNEDKNN